MQRWDSTRNSETGEATLSIPRRVVVDYLRLIRRGMSEVCCGGSSRNPMGTVLFDHWAWSELVSPLLPSFSLVA